MKKIIKLISPFVAILLLFEATFAYYPETIIVHAWTNDVQVFKGDEFNLTFALRKQNGRDVLNDPRIKGYSALSEGLFLKKSDESPNGNGEYNCKIANGTDEGKGIVKIYFRMPDNNNFGFSTNFYPKYVFPPDKFIQKTVIPAAWLGIFGILAACMGVGYFGASHLSASGESVLTLSEALIAYFFIGGGYITYKESTLGYSFESNEGDRHIYLKLNELSSKEVNSFFSKDF